MSSYRLSRKVERKKVTSSSGRERTRIVSLQRSVLFRQPTSDPVMLFDYCIYYAIKINMIVLQKLLLLIYQ